MKTKDKTTTTDFKMPKMGESITEGTIINWLVAVGDEFEEGDVLVEVATDKVDNEIPAPFSGRVAEILCDTNEVVEVGTSIARLELAEVGNTDEIKKQLVISSPNTSAKANKGNKASGKSTTKKTEQKSSSSKNYSIPSNQNTFISPLVNQIARKEHISYEELARIKGTGKDGRLRKSDIYQYLEEGRPAQFAQPVAPIDEEAFRLPKIKLDKGTGEIVAMDRMRQMIADHMVYSKHTSPHVTAYVEADLTDLVNWRTANKQEFQEKHGERLTFTPLIIQAVAKAIQEFPMINVSVDGTNIIVKKEINIGMATALPSGNLIVPVVKNADQKSLLQIAKDVNQLSAKARENNLGGDDIKGSTFTISNVGTFGSLMGTPIINQPEAAILATGIIKKRAEVMERPEGDSIEIRQMMYLSLSFDHRIVDGYLGGSFLRRIADHLENFEQEQV
ncbi:dihydrolipoamide acetyltransferase family protein [Gangjinia marincola]|uniref:Dihydrolipoamide acetyltransferase component of pyruvate dehydrogenase complex n=1 Tax=Gangjinia marincola TaxID=578463 RepID=A0ABN1ME36_9FLAO